MQSAGGFCPPDVARRYPIRLLESGPAAGALSAAHAGASVGLADLLGFDMGGTTAKAGIIERGEFTFYDIHMNARRGRELVRNTLTIVNGRELPVTADGPQAPWIELTEAQQALLERGHTPAAMAKGSTCAC